MIRGRFGQTTGRPYIEGRLIIPKLNVDAIVSFLVDTGADTSLLAPADGRAVGVDHQRLGKVVTSLGTGGLAESQTVRASLVFTDPGRAHYIYHLDPLDVAVPHPDIDEMPSLLGREVLDRWRMTYDPTKPELSFRVRSADRVVPIS